MKGFFLRWILPFLFDKVIKLIKNWFESKEEQKEEEVKTPPKKQPIEPPKTEPEPKPLPNPPKFEEGDFNVIRGDVFFAELEQHKDLPVCIKHRSGSLILVNTSIGDELYADSFLLQTVGNVRLSLKLNNVGKRYLSIKRNGIVVAGKSIEVLK